jgi:hypothetical protein
MAAEGTEGLIRRFLAAAETPLCCNAEHLSPASAGLFLRRLAAHMRAASTRIPASALLARAMHRGRS